MQVRHRADWNLPLSYWEWFKMIGTAFLISCGMTAAAGAVWWFALQ
jgi:hypothetical protein